MAEWKPNVRRVAAGDDQEKLAFINSLLFERRFEEAGAAADDLLKNNDRSYGANMAKGRALQGQRKFSDSIAYFQRAAEIDPMQSAAYLMAGLSAFLCEDIDLAQEKFRAAVDIDPTLAAGFLGLAQIQFRRSEFDGALVNIDKALKQNPSMGPAMLLRARILSKTGDLAGAIAELTHLTQAKPENRAAVIALAGAHLQREDYQSAATVLEAALMRRGEDAAMSSMLGKARLQLGDYAGAEVAIRESMKDQSKLKNLGRSLQLSEALIRQGKLDEARAILSAVPKFGPLTALVKTRLGDLLFEEGDFEEAVKSYRTALLKAEGGEAIVASIENWAKPTAVADDLERLAARYREAAARRMEEAQKSFGEQDWQVLLDKYRPYISQFMNPERAGGRA